MKLLSLLAAACVAAGCTGQPLSPDDVRGPLPFGETANVMQAGKVYVSGQPDRAGLAAARAAGVTTVINLREAGEHDWDEAAAARELGLEYLSIPVARRSDTLSDDAIAALGSALASRRGEPVLLHCSSGNRAAAAYAAYLATRHGYSLDAALAIGRRAGITREALEQRVHNYVAAQ